MSEAESYREAIRVLRRDGWCQWSRGNLDGKHCLLGALDKASGRRNTIGIDWPALRQVTDCGIIQFNDDCCERASDAIVALEIAAALAS